MAKRDYSFSDLGRDLRKIANNIAPMVSDTVVSYTFAFGSQLAYRTPRDTGRAVFNWIARIDSPSSSLRATMNNRPDSKSQGLNFAINDLWANLRPFDANKNKSFYITNNLAYIHKLAYENWARRKKTSPHAPPYWMIEQNINEIDFNNYVGDLFKGIRL